MSDATIFIGGAAVYFPEFEDMNMEMYSGIEL